MGQEMIGFLLVGPKSLKDKRAEAIAHIAEEVKVAKEIEATLMEGKVLSSDQINFLEVHAVDADYIENIQAAYTDVITDVSPEKWVDDFIDFWENTFARDTADRFYGDKKIIFAGEATWGDEPDGYGYTLLKTLVMLNVTDIFGIE